MAGPGAGSAVRGLSAGSPAAPCWRPSSEGRAPPSRGPGALVWGTWAAEDSGLLPLGAAALQALREKTVTMPARCGRQMAQEGSGQGEQAEGSSRARLAESGSQRTICSSTLFAGDPVQRALSYQNLRHPSIAAPPRPAGRPALWIVRGGGPAVTGPGSCGVPAGDRCQVHAEPGGWSGGGGTVSRSRAGRGWGLN